MGLDWRDAVALMGAHSLGRGSAEFSGHEGTWVDTARDAQRFDKQYYEEIVFNAWRPRNVGLDSQDFTTGNNNRNDRMMLNTDICLVFNIDNNFACCTKTDEGMKSRHIYLSFSNKNVSYNLVCYSFSKWPKQMY
jgi:hypothetical protein